MSDRPDSKEQSVTYNDADRQASPTSDLFARIAADDPDGWEHREPTNADRDAFRATVIRDHGKATWDAYVAAGKPVER